MTKFWGKAAVMGEPTVDGRILHPGSIDVSEMPIPLTRSGYWNHYESSNVLGVITKAGFAEEEGRTFLLFSGDWREDPGDILMDVFLSVYPFLKYPAIYVSDIVQSENLITAAVLRAINLVEDSAWSGCFIEKGELPERYGIV